MSLSVLIFCSASDGVSPVYFAEADELARGLVAKGHRIIFGGGKPGIMGRVADSALKVQGEVIGVIPEYLCKEGIVHRGLTELHVVDHLLDRKQKMLSLSDVIIAFPGGVGTIDEITEVIALKQLGEHNKPIIFYNYLSFWDPLLDFFVELKERHMISQNLEDLFLTFNNTQSVLEYLSKCNLNG
jgi:uncharacterized protein (TIGR00730 family)